MIFIDLLVRKLWVSIHGCFVVNLATNENSNPFTFKYIKKDFLLDIFIKVVLFRLILRLLQWFDAGYLPVTVAVLVQL